jgi:hypothetical protein
MKRKYLLVSFLILSSFWIKAQSITIDPSQVDENTIIKKDGIGLSHQSVDDAIKIGTKVADGDAIIQTHTDHNLSFGTFNSSP